MLCCRLEKCSVPWLKNLPLQSLLNTFCTPLANSPEFTLWGLQKCHIYPWTFGHFSSIQFLPCFVITRHRNSSLQSLCQPAGFTTPWHQPSNYELCTKSSNDLSHWRVSASHWCSQSIWNPKLSTEKEYNFRAFYLQDILLLFSSSCWGISTNVSTKIESHKWRKVYVYVEN